MNLACKGVIQEYTVPYSPQSNGICERLNRTIMGAAVCMLFDANLPKCYWQEAVNYAVFIRNMCPTDILGKKTPNELWFGRKPNISKLITFGAVVYCQIPKSFRRKLDSKVEEARFIGYSLTQKGYRVTDVESQQIWVTRDLVVKHTDGSETKLLYGPGDITGEGREEDSEEEESEIEEEKSHLLPLHSTDTSPAASPEIPKKRLVEVEKEQNIEEEREEEPEKVNLPDITYEEDDLTRDTLPGGYFNFFGNQAKEIAMAATANPLSDTPSYTKAISGPESEGWQSAMQAEVRALEKKAVYVKVPYSSVPPGVKVINSIWVLTKKYDGDGNFVKFKGRAVFCGDQQPLSKEYQDTFAATLKMATIRAIIAAAASNKWEIEQMDVSTAFLNGEMDEPHVYMRLPPGFEEVDKQGRPLVALLKKAIYGYRRSNKIWSKAISKTLKEFGLMQSQADHCLYYKEGLWVMVYVDDLIICACNSGKVKEMKEFLSKKYDMKDLGKIRIFLNCEIIRNYEEGTVALCQKLYIINLLAKFNMTDCNPVLTPVEVGFDVPELYTERTVEEAKEMEKVPYREAVGSLVYAMTYTRYDIAFAVSIVSKFMQTPKPIHWSMVKRIFRYLKGTTDLAIFFGGVENKELNLKAFADASYASDVNSRKSITGILIRAFGGMVAWSSKRQGTVALSTTEAEYMGLASVTQEVIWQRQLFKDLGFLDEMEPTIIAQDNQGTICLASDPTNHTRAKHIDVRHHFLRECIDEGKVKVEYCPTKEMLADMCTKALPAPLFLDLRKRSGMSPV